MQREGHGEPASEGSAVSPHSQGPAGDEGPDDDHLGQEGSRRACSFYLRTGTCAVSCCRCNDLRAWGGLLAGRRRGIRDSARAVDAARTTRRGWVAPTLVQARAGRSCLLTYTLIIEFQNTQPVDAVWRRVPLPPPGRETARAAQQPQPTPSPGRAGETEKKRGRGMACHGCFGSTVAGGRRRRIAANE